jgi:hypothetical protein
VSGLENIAPLLHGRAAERVARGRGDAHHARVIHHRLGVDIPEIDTQTAYAGREQLPMSTVNSSYGNHEPGPCEAASPYRCVPGLHA